MWPPPVPLPDTAQHAAFQEAGEYRAEGRKTAKKQKRIMKKQQNRCCTRINGKNTPKKWGGKEECSHLQNTAWAEAGDTGSVDRHSKLRIYGNKRIFYYSCQQSCPVPPPTRANSPSITSGTFITGRCPECIKLVPYESSVRKHLCDPYSVSRRGWSGNAKGEGGFMQTHVSGLMGQQCSAGTMQRDRILPAPLRVLT